ncbi:hypothetical protein AnigIFM60653_006528 [Aspergillus niger]|nr:hypothetical protein AnigIFM49718_003343 [Aspergillus niger]GKZ70551.1 hypothetical protein AnigIFM50267_006205 [Aspergillus niger]GLA06007.1 hypothetical protein AnigIFM60653_006528 [Aspergillus niger]
MRDMSSKFIEILDPNDTRPRMSDCDVRLEDVLADHEALVTRPRSSTQSSSKPSLDNRLDRDAPTSPTQRWKRLSTILVPARRETIKAKTKRYEDTDMTREFDRSG